MGVMAADAGGPTVKLVAGIDSSTQSCKVVVCDAGTGEIVREGRASHPDGAEIDPVAWESAAASAITAAGGFDDRRCCGMTPARPMRRRHW